MAIVQTITALPAPPNPSTDDAAAFASKASAFTQALVTMGTQLNTFASEVNVTQAEMDSAQTGAAIGITYTWSSSTTAADPGAGNIRLNNASVASATAMYVSNTSKQSQDWSGVLSQFTSSTSTVKGYLKLHKAGDGTKWAAFSITSMTSPTGYRSIVIAHVASSSNTPFVAGDTLVLTFDRNGDAASGGGAAISDIILQTQNAATTGGTATAYTLTPGTPLTSYTANATYFVKFHAASGENPTLAISGLATPPSLVKQMADGSYSNIVTGDFPINHTSKVTLLSASQALVEQLPVNAGASDFANKTFSAAYTIARGDRGMLLVHPSADTTARTLTIPANASVPLPIGFTFTVANQNAAGAVTIAVTTDTLRFIGSGGTGNRTLAANGLATLVKITATEWMISGGGVS